MSGFASITDVEVRHFHLFGGLGGGAKGFNRGEARVGNLRAKFRCLGAIDADPAAIRDFERLAGVPATCRDLFSRDQYRAFHGREPSTDWVEAVPDDVCRAAQGERPHILFLSAPCKGFSGLLSEVLSRSAKYQALNDLTVRGVWLALEAWGDDPPELIVFENVPRIATRGRRLLDRIVALLRHYGYAVAETTHDCGELGGLAQSRKRFLLVARHIAKVPPFLYEPAKHALRGVGEVLDKLPMPLSGLGGPMHRMPSLHWKTWVRLAFVEAGSDWRSLNRLRVADGVLTDYGIAEEAQCYRGAYGVTGWDEHSGTVTAGGRPGQGNFSVADPRIDGHERSVQMGVRRWDQVAPVVTGKMFAGGGPNSVADPRIPGKPRFNNVFRIVPWGATSPAVAGPGGPAGGLAVADPRPSQRADYKQTKYRVTGFDEAAGAVIGASSTGNGAFSVADPRPGFGPATHHHVLKVTRWDRAGGTITASHHPAGGALCVADPREIAPAPDERLVAVIRALDGTWHRPFTTLELAALQGLADPEETLELDGLADSAWRERIGNAVPPPAAAAIASVMGRTLLMAWSGQTFMLISEPIWVQPIAVALSVLPGEAT